MSGEGILSNDPASCVICRSDCALIVPCGCKDEIETAGEGLHTAPGMPEGAGGPHSASPSGESVSA